jgi:hypothetical protein
MNPSGPRPSHGHPEGHTTLDPTSRSGFVLMARARPTMSVDHGDLGRLAEPTVADIAVDR